MTRWAERVNLAGWLIRPAGRRPWRLSRWSLRTRLLVALLVLLTLICVAISVLVSVVLRQFLVGQLDDQLLRTERRAAAFVPPAAAPYAADEPVGVEGPGTPRPGGPGQTRGTLLARVSGGQVVWAGVSAAFGETQQVPASARSAILAVPTDGRRYTRTLGPLGDYRLVAVPDRFGTITITGLPMSGVQDTLTRLAVTEAVVLGAGLVVLGLVGATIIRATLRPLRRVAATATRVSELQLDSGEVALAVRVPAADTDPATEVGQVGAALNRMLGHVGAALAARQASETRVRKFVADASHELRTPLAAIRGYAELVRRANGNVPGDIAHAMRRVESETARMTMLVEDLLLLARLDSGRPLAREPVDLSRMLVDAVSDARIAGPEHRWRLRMPDYPVTVTGDEARLHQVLTNLLANARTHTPAGTLVAVGLAAAADGHATLTVSDDGPGIPGELQPQVFDRFARGDSSRSRAAGGTGLGLSIVAAVVQAHHGTVTLHSAPGRTVFSVRLPGAQVPAGRRAGHPLAVTGRESGR